MKNLHQKLNQSDSSTDFIMSASNIRIRQRRVCKKKIRAKKLATAKCLTHHVTLTDFEDVRRILLNTESEINLIRHSLCKKLDLMISDVSTKNIQIINEKVISSHDVHFLNIEISNHAEHQRYFEEFFLAMNMQKNLVLDMS